MINLRLEAASDVQECLATLRSLTSRRTEAQRRAMPLRPDLLGEWSGLHGSGPCVGPVKRNGPWRCLG